MLLCIINNWSHRVSYEFVVEFSDILRTSFSFKRGSKFKLCHVLFFFSYFPWGLEGRPKTALLDSITKVIVSRFRRGIPP